VDYFLLVDYFISRLLVDYRLVDGSLTGSTDRRVGSGQPRTARTEDNVAHVEELVLSQEAAPQSHRSTRQISREIGVHQSSVLRIIHNDLTLTVEVYEKAASPGAD